MNIIEKLPKDIIFKIIPFTYSPQIESLRKDITTFHLTLNKLCNLYAFRDNDTVFTQSEFEEMLKIDILEYNRNIYPQNISLELEAKLIKYKNRNDHKNVIRTIIGKWTPGDRLKYMVKLIKIIDN